MKLYEISNEMQSLVDTLEDLENIPEHIAEDLDKLNIEFDDKVEQLVLWMKGVQIDIQALKEEEDRLYKRRKSLQNTVDWIKNYINIHTGDQYKLKTPYINVYKMRTMSVDIPDNYDLSNLVDDGFCTPVVTYKPDKTKLKYELENTGIPIRDRAGNQISLVSNTHIVVR